MKIVPLESIATPPISADPRQDEDRPERFQDRTERGDDDERENVERAESLQLARESLIEGSRRFNRHHACSSSFVGPSTF
jgi:hypothetical protein